MKPGPYEPQLDKEFAEWAPLEGDPAAALFLSWLENAVSGEVWSGNVEPAMGQAAAAAEDG